MNDSPPPSLPPPSPPLPTGSALRVRTQPLLTAGCLVASDMLTLSGAMVAAVYIRLFYDGQFHPSLFLRLWPVLFIFMGTFGFLRLYFGMAPSPADELRRICQGCFLVYLALGSITYLAGVGDVYSRGVYIIALVLSVALVPLGRITTRRLCAGRRWWGYPAAVIGAGPLAHDVVANLHNQPGLGLRPVAVLADTDEHSLDGVPILPLSAADDLARRVRVPFAILAMEGRDRAELIDLAERQAERFPHLLLVPDLYGVASLWVEAKDLGGILGLELRRNLLLPWPRLLKRSLDLFGAVVGGLAILPVIGLFALLIKLDSRGPVFYRQERLGLGRRSFQAWKFRSMVAEADVVLERYLSEHPELQAEWEATRKLRDDPRVTRMGRFLRKTSLDELPQLWNVLLGQMSLVGPRPIVEAEVERYGRLFQLYTSVRPGMSGLWQVSGRSDTGYGERVQLDAYYVRNWSVWLDIYILARTVKTVALGRGAY